MVPHTAFRTILATLAICALPGCAAALIPVAAGSLMATRGETAPQRAIAEPAAGTPAPSVTAAEAGPTPNALPASRALLERLRASPEAPEVELVGTAALPPPSGKGIALRLLSDNRAYDSFFGRVVSQLAQEPDGADRSSALLANPGNLDATTLPCGQRPPGVMIDIDPAGALVPLEGEPSLNAPLSRIVSALRSRGVTIFWVTGRNAAFAGEIRERLSLSDLDPAGQDTLVTMRYPDDRKQTRRRDFATDYCVVALLGDEKADFDELYDYLRSPDDAVTLERLLGTRWFLAPTPLD